MTLKNLLTSTEKPTLILLCKTAWRLRSVICILIFSICTLLGQNNCFAQVFNAVGTNDKYRESDLFSVLTPGQALLFYTVKPNSNINVDSVVTYENMLTRNHYFDLSLYGSTANVGRLYTSGGAYHCVSIVDAENFYFNTLSVSTNLTDVFLPKLNDALKSKNLGTVAQRRSYIEYLDKSVIVSPYDFRSYIQPWVIVGLVIAILIPAWYLCRRFLRG